MLILALDSTTPAGSVGVGRDAAVAAAHAGDATRPHGERLPGDLLAILAETGHVLAEVDLYAVAIGPGAFTGLRIGIAAIQGLAFASGRPVVGISALDALAHGACASRQLEAGVLLGVWMDAARHEVFAALYEVERDGADPARMRPRIVEEPSVGAAAAILTGWATHLASRTTWLVGDGGLRYREVATAYAGTVRIVETWPPVAASMIPLAVEAHARGLAGPPHAVRPLYVRRPDAEIARDQRTAHDAPAR